jgi:hypothetical protein
MTFTFGMRSGMINVAAASFWGIGAYATGMLMTNGGMTFWQALPLSLLISFVLALFLAAIICRFAGMSGMMFGIVFASIVPVAFGTFEIFGKQSGLTGIPGVTDLGLIHFGSKASTITDPSLRPSSADHYAGVHQGVDRRSWLGLGSSQKLAESVGIDLYGYWIINFAIMSVIPALPAPHTPATWEPSSRSPSDRSYWYQLPDRRLCGRARLPCRRAIVGALFTTASSGTLRVAGATSRSSRPSSSSS